MKKIDWIIGEGCAERSNGFISDFYGKPVSSKYPEVGSALYTRTRLNGQTLWSERRPMHRERAAKLGLI